MNIQFTARHFTASDMLRESITDQVRDLTRFFENIISVHVVLDAEDKLRRTAELVVATRGKSITGKGSGENMGKAVDQAFSKVERQLKKLNQKIKGHKEKGLRKTMQESM
ncbi:MAG: ribosomal subunit interface protein [Candidatus Raymondbacteria bacterium RifOxyA12_full_50_37]|uniref:Ribosomal subunit interface protein n=1 Tax=Candidatus Raymondbacteria bacterium RIFOXYD12_FULL_49_13 TaxID=1817890 RepID=A0A1F7FBX0_UNCRA|nr:MAG: ribosomal subunit interface protein [Candidatus Raymondbacteria bacterium RifOxyA12_full_50_37]OGJ92542.1 MAG: ribosomal subunit interface protein [Candidatus Raymondbacteria bacterium RIFOXYA2_FULL_49_16]OGJ97896.1 MAG: ribosomal subunit interface protein [Candidatus Raymondbacteria bacterium RIFOXYC2_FULL_50_21]OGK00517.1 MAG: ribosomal subunit interface protein [Candidatus Raymondbacteria bacterium RifOxyB12_full_50_8]OGK03987.1 MAG: ribosomal subunit interface protein [Candidatus Ra